MEKIGGIRMRKILFVLFPLIFVFISCSNELGGALILRMPNYSVPSREGDDVSSDVQDMAGTTSSSNDNVAESIYYELDIKGPTKTKITAQENELIQINNLTAGDYDVECCAFYKSDKSFFCSGVTQNIKVEPFRMCKTNVCLEKKTLLPTIENIMVGEPVNDEPMVAPFCIIAFEVNINQRGNLTASFSSKNNGTTTNYSAQTSTTSSSNFENPWEEEYSSSEEFSSSHLFMGSVNLTKTEQKIKVQVSFSPDWNPKPVTVDSDWITIPAAM